jgi:uncharacterized protein
MPKLPDSGRIRNNSPLAFFMARFFSREARPKTFGNLTARIWKYLRYFLIACLALWIAVIPAWGGLVPTEKSLLWELTGNGLAKPSYLFGTIHLQCKNRLALSANRQKYFNNTEQLFLELDFSDPNLKQEISKYTQMPRGQNLKKLLGPKKYRRAQQYFAKQLNLPLDFFSTTKPFVLAALATPSGLNCPTSSWEEALTAIAKQRKMPVRGLETVKEQFAVFKTLSLQEEANMLMAVIDNPEASRKSFQSLLSAYNNQDLVQLQKIMNSDPSSRKFNKVLLDRRNQKWIPIITKAARSKSTFFGFGAAHLPGNQGVIALLRKAGYTVKPMPN